MQDSIIFDSLDLLNQEEKNQYKSEINNSSEEDRNLISDYNNITSLFSKLITLNAKKIAPSESVKEKLFEKIKALENSKSNNSLQEKEKTDFNFVFSDSGEWSPYNMEGIKYKTLSNNADKGYMMLLFKVEPGVSYPAHHHNGSEECYVIEGDVLAEGKLLGPGDFHHAEAGSDHGQLHTKNGCTLLLVVDPADYS
ncbi:MAG: cupin domain-containing protein [Ignavibacteria bacterium]